jgi:hypothetical protein
MHSPLHQPDWSNQKCKCLTPFWQVSGNNLNERTTLIQCLNSVHVAGQRKNVFTCRIRYELNKRSRSLYTFLIFIWFLLVNISSFYVFYILFPLLSIERLVKILIINLIPNIFKTIKLATTEPVLYKVINKMKKVMLWYSVFDNE